MKVAWFIIRNPKLCWQFFSLNYQLEVLKIETTKARAECARLRKELEVLHGCKQ